MPPKRLRIGDVPAYILETYHLKVTRQTVYNWARVGKQGETLRTQTIAGQMYTSQGAVDAFIRVLSR